jgi:D-alanyl-lipoteichoic acid acyltransferase DltB (MBOAT superfamily)
MIFTSFNFVIFFPLVTILYWITPAKFKWLTLLVASYLFYINTKPVYVLLLTGVTASTYVFTLLIDRTNITSRKRTFMLLNILLILLPLFFYKYFIPLNNAIISLLGSRNITLSLPEIKLILPIGISFYTFMAIGYTIDVFNEETRAEKNPGIVALFISFFPLILSGPIERAGNMMPQFRASNKIDYGEISQGLKLMIWGYFMKLVVADRLGIYIDAVFNNIYEHNGNSFLLAAILYPFQLYADLGGYSLIAIGVSRTLNINVIHNFRRPFFANSMSEFWRRWHISLISWLTDYIFTPLSFALRKLKIWGIVIALISTFLISGIWHGANLTFIVWGFLQGTFLSIEALTKTRKSVFERKHNLTKSYVYTLFGIFLTFLLFAASQIFGRAQSLKDAFLIFNKILSERGPLFIDKTTLAYAISGLMILLMKDLFEEFFPEKILLFNNQNAIIRFTTYLFVVVSIVYFGVLNASQFIYFQF